MEDDRPVEQRERDREMDLRCTEKLLSYAVGAYQLQVANFDKLDSKAATLAGFVGVIIAVSTGVLKPTLEFPSSSPPESALVAVAVLHGAAVLLLAAAFCFCLLTLRARVNANPASIDDMIRHYRSLGPISTREPQLIKDMVKTYAEAERTRRENNQVKSRYLRSATVFLFLALASAILGYAAQFSLTIAMR